MNRAALLLISIAAAGCNLYSHGSGDDVVCNGGGTAGVAEYDSRDPSTGICTYSSYGGGGECDDGCCAEPAGGAIEAVGSTCDGACEGLDESDCLATAGCHGDYIANNNELGVVLPPTFEQCWDIQPLAPIEGGDCTQLDAYTCAQHDDCISLMDGISGEDGSQYGVFQACAAESTPPSQCDNVDCAPGSTCQVVCEPVSCPAGDGSGCMDGCAALCEPNTPDVGSCTGTVTCNIVGPTCPAGTVPGIDNGCYTGYCIPQADCTAPDPGTCDGTVLCNSAPPKCPAGTEPGVNSNNCWSGFCIPDSSCPAAACESLTDETSCDSRSDCESVYDGTGCTCDDNGCVCSSETWAACETAGDVGIGGGGGTGGGSGVNPGGPVMPAFVVRVHH